MARKGPLMRLTTVAAAVKPSDKNTFAFRSPFIKIQYIGLSEVYHTS